MSEVRSAVAEAAGRLFAAHCEPEGMRQAVPGRLLAPLWEAVRGAGFDRALLSEEAGGAGLEISDILPLLVSAGGYTVPAPLGETILASWLLLSAGLEVPDGPLTIAPVRAEDRVLARKDAQTWLIEGTARRVPWAGECQAMVVIAQSGQGSVIALVRASDYSVVSGRNLAGEPRDEVTFSGVRATSATLSPVDREALHRFGAVIRAAQIAGGLQRVLDLSVRYAGERVQFGRPIGQFQAVQQNLAVLACQAAAATAAADGGIMAFARNPDALLPIASAKARSSEAAGAGAAIAHQIFGAIGFTDEHHLHFSTRRLWSWREEFGNEIYWSRRIGGLIAAAGADQLWRIVTAA